MAVMEKTDLRLTFVSAVNDEEVYRSNFCSSPLFEGLHPHQLICRKGYCSTAKAYNGAIDEAENDLVAFVHQDVVLPASWIDCVKKAIDWLSDNDPEWGVLGCYGVTTEHEFVGHLFCASQGRILGQPFESPVEVATLDELILIVRGSTGIRFDELLPDFHFYGMDICMLARSRGNRCYAISAFCLHNANRTLRFPAGFFKAADYVRRRWRAFLPIKTTCIILRKSRADLYMRYRYLANLKLFALRVLGKDMGTATRFKDPLPILDKLLSRRDLQEGRGT